MLEEGISEEAYSAAAMLVGYEEDIVGKGRLRLLESPVGVK